MALLTSYAALPPSAASPYSYNYLPGVAPSTYVEGDPVLLKTTKVTSTKTPVQYEYYDLPFCRSGKRKSKSKAQSLGGRLSGDTLTKSPYELVMKKDLKCQVLCRKVLKKAEVEKFKDMIANDYRVHWDLDSLPVSIRNPEQGFMTRGYPVGFRTPSSKGVKAQHYIFNHVRITIKYNEDPALFEGGRIVGFEVVPFSIKHEYTEEEKRRRTAEVKKTISKNGASEPKAITLTTCNKISLGNSGHHTTTPLAQMLQSVEAADEEIVYSYDVKWEKSEIQWSQRWDVYLHGNPNDEIHYFSIVNSLMIVVFLSGVVAMIMLRTIHKDISSYNDTQTLEEAQEESGWKLVHGDVFRPPTASPMMLAILSGSGIQILAMTVCTMGCALVGLTSPANRGGLLTTLLILFVFMGSFNGYCSARLYKFFGGKLWKQCTLLTAVFYPGVMGVIYLGINFFVASQGSSTAAPITSLLALIMLWFGISTPLVVVGSYFGFKANMIEVPTRTNQIARHIPLQTWYTNPFFSVALGGILPFGAVCIELYFIMSAMWLHQIYFVFGFLFIVLAILIVTCAEITIVMCYFQLCNEDYRWWWRSFLSAGSSGLYLFLYSIWYFMSKLTITGVIPTTLYFAYMGMISLTFALLTGSIGFFACLWFVCRIYGAIKVD